MDKKIQMKDISTEEIILAVNEFHKNKGDTPDVALANKYPPKMILLKMKKMVEQGILDYGVSLKTAWVKQ